MSSAKERPLGVAMISSDFFPEVVGGAQQQCLRQAVALRRRGLHVVILTSRSRKSTPAVEIMDGVVVHRFLTRHPPHLGGTRMLSSLVWFVALFRWLWRHRDQFDIVHCHEARLTAFMGILVAQRVGLKSLVKIASTGAKFDFRRLEEKRGGWGRRPARYIRDHSDALVSISVEMSRELKHYGVEPPQLQFIPNGVTSPSRLFETKEQARREQRSALPLEEGDLVLVYVGQLSVPKNVDIAIKALGEVARHDLKLLILGDGELRTTLEKLVSEKGLQGRVAFLGNVPNVFDYLQAADIFLFPTSGEGLSNALLEAMAVGAVPIVSNTSGNVDLVRDGETGFVFDLAGREQACAEAIDRAIAAGAERLRQIGDRARTMIRQEYDIDMIAARYLRLYHDLLTADEEAAGTPAAISQAD